MGVKMDLRENTVGYSTKHYKAPSDAAKASLFSDWANLDIAYTPRFDPDRFILRFAR